MKIIKNYVVIKLGSLIKEKWIPVILVLQQKRSCTHLFLIGRRVTSSRPTYVSIGFKIIIGCRIKLDKF